VSVAHPHAHIVRCFDLVKGECLDVTTEWYGKCRLQTCI
jgi:hypothetical protein